MAYYDVNPPGTVPRAVQEEEDGGFWEAIRDNVLHPIRDFVFDPENIGTAVGFALGGPPGAAVGKMAGGAADRIGEKYLGTGEGLREADPITLGSAARDVGTGYLYGKGIEAIAPHAQSFTEGLFGGGESAGSMAGMPAPQMSAAATGGAPTIRPPMADLSSPLVGGSSAPTQLAPPALGSPVSAMSGAGSTQLMPPMVGQPVSPTGPVAADEGGFFSGLSGFWGDLSGLEKAALISQGLGTAANIYGTHQAGEIAEQQREMSLEDRRRRQNVGELIASLLGPELAAR